MTESVNNPERTSAKSEYYDFVNNNISNVSILNIESFAPLEMLTGEHPGYVLGIARYNNSEYCAILDINTFTVHINKIIQRVGNTILETDAITDLAIQALITAKFEDENMIHSLAVMEKVIHYIADSAARKRQIEYSVLREAIELAKKGYINIADLKDILFSTETPEKRYMKLYEIVNNRRKITIN